MTFHRYPKETLLGASNTSPYTVLWIGILGMLSLELLGNLLAYVFTGYFLDTTFGFIQLALNLHDTPQPIDSPLAVHLGRTLLVTTSHVIPVVVLGSMAGGWRETLSVQQKDHWWTWLAALAAAPLILYAVGGMEALMDQLGFTQWFKNQFAELEPRRSIAALTYLAAFQDHPFIAFFTTVLLALSVGAFYIGFMCRCLERAMGRTGVAVMLAGLLMALLRLHPSKLPLLLIPFLTVAWFRFHSKSMGPALLIHLIVSLGTFFMQVLSVDPSYLASTTLRAIGMLATGLGVIYLLMRWQQKKELAAEVDTPPQ